MNNTSSENPFFFQSASDLDTDQIIEYYQDGMYVTSALSSKQNCYLVGERGSGKSMALLYHSFPIQKKLNCKFSDCIGIYIPCNNTLMHKNESSLLEKSEKFASNEHFFSLAIAYNICRSLKDYCKLPPKRVQKQLLENFSYSLALDNIPFTNDIFTSISAAVIRECNSAQAKLNDIETRRLTKFYNFFTLILPILSVAKDVINLQHVHFSLLFDDAHLLSKSRQRILNSYLSYRDHSFFSFKVAIASNEDYIYLTSDGSTLLEGHDFSLITMEEDYQTARSDYGKFIRSIIEKRLKRSGIQVDPDSFFPESPSMARGIQEATEAIRAKAEKKFGLNESKKISDYIYKYARAEYFRTRQEKSRGRANLPQYSGLDTIAHVSTGVVRNALARCWEMYEAQFARDSSQPSKIAPEIQARVLLKASDDLWEKIRIGFSNVIEGCSQSDSKKIKNFFDQLGVLFRKRLLSDCSEPRILAFIISEQNSPAYEKIIKTLAICRKAQLIYERSGPGKDDGRRETYYATNRLLWVARGLDPNGQHGRLSLKASDILAASEGNNFPLNESESSSAPQATLFNL